MTSTSAPSSPLSFSIFLIFLAGCSHGKLLVSCRLLLHFFTNNLPPPSLPSSSLQPIYDDGLVASVVVNPLSLFSTFTGRNLRPVLLAVAPKTMITFNDRDFVNAEGFGHAGEWIMFEVFKGGVGGPLIGQALGITDGSMTEVNHPGGMHKQSHIINCRYPSPTNAPFLLSNHHNVHHHHHRLAGLCWGANAEVLWTPDIQAGDYVMLSFEDGTYVSQIVAAARTTAFTIAGNTLTASGTLGPNDSLVNLESRILNTGELCSWLLPCCRLCGSYFWYHGC